MSSFLRKQESSLQAAPLDRQFSPHFHEEILTHDMNAAEDRVIAASSLAAYSVVAGHFDNS